MSGRAAILKALTNSPNTAVDRVVELALAYASPAEQRELAAVLLERNRRAGWVALIRVFDRLEEEVKQTVLARPRELFGPLAEAMNDPEGLSRVNVIQIVGRCADGKLVYLLAEALMDARPEVRTLAAESLLQAVRKFKSLGDAWQPEDHNLPQLQRAVNVALRQFKTHRQQGTVLAAFILERQQNAALWAHFQDPLDELTRAATALLRAPADPFSMGGLLLALGSPLRPAAMAGVAAIEAGPTGDALAQESYRLLDPTLRQSGKSISHVRALAFQKGKGPWTSETWSGWLRLIVSLGFPVGQKLFLLHHMLGDIPVDAVVWKLSLVQALAETGTVEAGRIIAPLTADPDERVARSAARYLLGKGHTEWRNMAALLLPKSPHSSVRRWAAGLKTLAGNESFDRVWGEYQKMPPAVQHSVTRSGVGDPDFAGRLKEKLASVQPLEIAQGLKMLSAVPDLASYRAAIITLCGHDDPRITAIAVRLLGRMEDPKLKDLLEAAAKHDDPRVRANAVESMATLHIADKSQHVLTMLNSRHNRERANAIKAISEFDYFTARDCLERMLIDPNPMHRISALWVVEQLQLMNVIRRVSSIARRDPNLRVRRRATEMLETLTTNVTAPV